MNAETPFQIKLLSVQPSRKKSKSVCADLTVAFCTSKGNLVLSDIQVLENSNGVLWLSLPNAPTGDGRYAPVVRLTGDMALGVPMVILETFKEWVSLNAAKCDGFHVRQ